MLSLLGVTEPFDSNHRLVSSPWYSPRVLAFQRLLLLAYSGATLITSLVYESVVIRQGNIWFSFFTHLTFTGLTAYLLVSTYHDFNYKPSASSSYAYPLQRWPRVLQAMHILLISTVTTFPILVSIAYWALLASSATFATPYTTWSAVSLHIFNTVFALLEITTTNIPPLPWAALPMCLILLLAYLGVAYITHATQGIYAYAFLDPQTQHGKLAAYIIGIAVGEVIIFTLVRYAIVLRDKISKFSVYHDEGTQQGTSEALEEWEEVQWDGAVQRRESAGSGSSQSPTSRKPMVEVKMGTAI